MVSNKNSKESAYSSELEKYMDEQENLDYDLSQDIESNFQTSKIKSSKLDEYLGVDNEKEDEEINYCSICGKKLKKFNYGNKCDDCVKKVELVKELNQLLDYVYPLQELEKETLLRAGFDELKLNILISNLLNEKLIILAPGGIFLADVKTLNDFFKVYGSDNDILEESRFKKLRSSEDFVNLDDYSDFVQIIFNPKNDKWEVRLFREGRQIIKKFFVGILDANNFATRYLNEMGVFDNPFVERYIKPQDVKYRRSKHKFVYFSVKNNRWYVRVKGHVGSKFVGFYDTEEEAVVARDEYIQKKKENQAKLRPKKFTKNESDAIISLDNKTGYWIVKVKNKRGGFKKLGYFDTEDEAIAAKNEYYGVGVELKEESNPIFSEGDRVQIISGNFEFEFGIINGFYEERNSFIVKLDNPSVPRPVFFKEDQLKLV